MFLSLSLSCCSSCDGELFLLLSPSSLSVSLCVDVQMKLIILCGLGLLIINIYIDHMPVGF